ncbi:reticulocyte-binding protein 2 like protein a [Phlyctema vagabunda]|uniref:Reticulocyte-binding protein 2 like protein a n=1 Tax=Phlyctema vagabunda TaxID=108571 RepID=A0ABR4PYG0_9HELO
MAALHDALKTLGPTDYNDVPVSSLDVLKPFLADTFSDGQLIVDSVPLPPAAGNPVSSEGRDGTFSSASRASDIIPSSARTPPPPPDVEALQKEWKPVKLNAKDNPLGMSVYKAAGKDGRGAWFARRSVHEGLGFTKWKRSLEKEFPESTRVQGAPGAGNVRGIGGERRVEVKNIPGVGKLEVYHLSAQFPGPTAPRDFVTLLVTSDQALTQQSGSDEEVPRHYMVISKPCSHPDAPPKDGFIRGQYESVEFIREIPLKKPTKSASATNLSNGNGHVEQNGLEPGSTGSSGVSRADSRARGKTISYAGSRGSEAKGERFDTPREDDESEQNPVEWIMITRSDPGGSVPRFMIERGTPSAIVSDASKFLDWACGKDMDDLQPEDEDSVAPEQQTADEGVQHPRHERHSLDYNAESHLAGLDGSTEKSKSSSPGAPLPQPPETVATNGGGLYGMVTGAAGAAGAMIAAHTPAMISSHLPGGTAQPTPESDIAASPRRDSLSSIASTSSVGSFTSALTHTHLSHQPTNDAGSVRTNSESVTRSRASSHQEKELQKLEDKKRKLDEKLNKSREKELNRKSDDTVKEDEAIKKAEERHERELAKLEAKKEKELAKLEAKRRKEELKAEERRRKSQEKDDRVRMARELDEVHAEVALLRKEKDILRSQVGDLQAENTALAARLGRLGVQGDQVLREVRAEVDKAGRFRASSIKGMGLVRSSSFKSVAAVSTASSADKEKMPALDPQSSGPGAAVGEREQHPQQIPISSS